MPKMATRRLVRTCLAFASGAACLSFLLVPALVSSGVIERLPEAVLARYVDTYGDDARARLVEWDLLLGQPGGSEADRNLRVNDFFNQVPWVDDREAWGRRDYWATPYEMLGANKGDCEDFSIAKYFSLKQLHVPGEKLLVTYVRAPRLGQTHMVLAYYPSPNADPYILDNITNEIRRGSERTDLIPVYSFNAEGLWKSIERGRGKRVGGAKKLHAWRGVLKRMEAHGWPRPGLS